MVHEKNTPRLSPDSTGRPLPRQIRRAMEELFGADFSDVRVHVGPEAASIGARAFAAGRHIYFAPGRYRPWSRSGRRLLAHELTHVLQQRTGRVRLPSGAFGVVEDATLEAEADQMGALAAEWHPGSKCQTQRGVQRPVLAESSPQPPAVVIQCAWEEGHFEPTKKGTFTHRCSDYPELGTLYWHASLKDEKVFVAGKLSQRLKTIDELKRLSSKFRRSDAHPWVPSSKKLVPLDPRMGIGKPRGSGGVRTVSGQGHKFHVRGKISRMLLEFLRQLDDWTDSDLGLETRISYGNDVPVLMSDVPISASGTATEGDGGSETIPPSLLSKALLKKVVEGNHIDKKLLNAWNGKRQVDHNKSQGEVMASASLDDEELDDEDSDTEANENLSDPSSATSLAKARGFKAKVGNHGWEWLHLIAYSMGGFKGYPQYPDNLVLGTWHANSAHLIIESAVKKLASMTNETFRIDAMAEYYDGTHFGRTILYRISTSQQRQMDFVIDCLMRVRPTSHDQKYWMLIMADQLLSQWDAAEVMHEIVMAQKKSVKEKAKITLPPLSFIPPSPLHYSHQDESALKSPVMKTNGTIRDEDYLERMLERKSGTKDKRGAVYTHKKRLHEEDASSVFKLRKSTNSITKSKVSIPAKELPDRLFKNKRDKKKEREHILKSVKKSGQYPGFIFQVEDNQFLKIKNYDPENDMFDLIEYTPDDKK